MAITLVSASMPLLVEISHKIVGGTNSYETDERSCKSFHVLVITRKTVHRNEAIVNNNKKN